MSGRFDPVRDSVESSGAGDNRRSVSTEAGHHKNARSASIADILNDNGSRGSSASNNPPSTAYDTAYGHRGSDSRPSSPGFTPSHRSSRYDSPVREDGARYPSPRERPLLHPERVPSSGRYHSPADNSSQIHISVPSRDIRSERSPSLLHILNSNTHLDDSHRTPSSSSSIHSLGAPYASNNSPDAEYHARMQSQPHAHVGGSPAQRHSMQPSTQRASYQSVRSSTSMGSSAEFVVPDVPHRSPETLRGRMSLPQTGPSYSPGHSVHGAPHTHYPSPGHEGMERDAYGRPLAPGPGVPRSPGSYGVVQHGSVPPQLPPTMHGRTPAPLHIETASHQPPQGHYPHSPSQLPQTPYSAAAQSPHRFPPTPGAFATTPGEYMGPPMFHTPRQHSISDMHALSVPTFGRNSGSRSPSQPGVGGQYHYGEAEGHRVHANGPYDPVQMREAEARRMEMLHHERVHEEHLARAEHERRVWEEREAHAEQERYAMEMRTREVELENMRRFRAEEEEFAARRRQQQEVESKEEADQIVPSPLAPPAKKRKEEAPARLIKKSGHVEELHDGQIEDAKSVNGISSKSKKIGKSEKHIVAEAPVKQEVAVEAEVDDEIAAANKEAMLRRGRPYGPAKRVSVPTTIRMPVTTEELERLRQQHRNPLRHNWQEANPGRSDGWKELIADFEAHQIKVPKESAEGTKKRKRTAANAKTAKAESLPDAVEVNAKLVAEHYNARRDVGVGQRKHSPIIELRNYNNWVKSLLIQRYGQPRGRALELGGGKGGDLNKWDRVRINHFVLADIAEVSVAQARSRFNERRFNYTADFIAGDCFGEPLVNWIPEHLLEPMFDNLSLQFCLHYGWESPATARQMMDNIARYLRPGGTFIGTMPDCRELRNRLQTAVDEKRSAKSFGNRFYQVEFQNVPLDPDGQVQLEPFGHKYTFSLLDAVDDVAEYVVDWDHFDSLAQQNGLRCIFRKNFQELWHEEGRPANSQMREAAKRMTTRPDSDVPIEPALWEATTVYVAFAFEKLR